MLLLEIDFGLKFEELSVQVKTLSFYLMKLVKEEKS